MRAIRTTALVFAALAGLLNGQSRVTLTDLDQRLTAVEQKRTPQQIALLRWYEGINAVSYAVGSAPKGIAFDGANVWVANNVSNTVSKLHASDGAALAWVYRHAEVIQRQERNGNIRLKLRIRPQDAARIQNRFPGKAKLDQKTAADS